MHGTPLSVTAKLWPATLTYPDRLIDELFEETVKPTLPSPDPPVALMAIQPTSVPADHKQPVPAVTLAVPVPPEAPNVCWVMDVEYEHEPLNVNGFDGALGALPTGPTADTFAV